MFAVAVSRQTFALSSSSYILSTSSLMFPGLRKYGIQVLFRAEEQITIYIKHLELPQSLYFLAGDYKETFLIKHKSSICMSSLGSGKEQKC